MSDHWLLLVPAGLEVESYVSPAVEVPTLVTRADLNAMALAVAQLLEQGLPADLGAMIRARARGQAPELPGQQTLVANDYTPPRVAETHNHSCTCAKFFRSELELQGHWREHPDHNPKFIPADRRVD